MNAQTTTQKIKKPSVTCSVSLEQKQANAILAYNALLKAGYTVSLNFNCLGSAEISVHDEKDLLKIKQFVAKYGVVIPKLNKKTFASQDSQYASGWNEEKDTELTVFANGVFNGCHIETIQETIEIPEQHIEAHTETRTIKKIVCGDKSAN